jgi:hypothetical protein
LPLQRAERSQGNGALHPRQRTPVGGIGGYRDTSAIERILADDFIGVDPKGRLYIKQLMIEETRNAPQYFVSNRLNDVKVRFYGTTAIAQGSETWEKRSGERGRFVWTDTWLQRNGRWQIVAAEDLIAPEKSD